MELLPDGRGQHVPHATLDTVVWNGGLVVHPTPSVAASLVPESVEAARALGEDALKIIKIIVDASKKKDGIKGDTRALAWFEWDAAALYDALGTAECVVFAGSPCAVALNADPRSFVRCVAHGAVRPWDGVSADGPIVTGGSGGSVHHSFAPLCVTKGRVHGSALCAKNGYGRPTVVRLNAPDKGLH